MIHDQTAGSYWIDQRGEDGVRAFWFYCPCGCGNCSRIIIGEEFKPIQSPSWDWNGSFAEPTLSPSVNQGLCGWHGWLADGYWRPAA
ncbi:MAG: DUF6527 family protein [Pseudomonadota bacterium]